MSKYAANAMQVMMFIRNGHDVRYASELYHASLSFRFFAGASDRSSVSNVDCCFPRRTLSMAFVNAASGAICMSLMYVSSRRV